MHHISKNAIVPYSAQNMYQLVNRVEDYPVFLNWCLSAHIMSQNSDEMVARIEINQSLFKQSFTTINRLEKNSRIVMSLQEGPFETLNGEWLFKSLTDNACKVNLSLEFCFRNRLMDKMMAPIFADIANRQLDAFIKRAQEVYGY